MKNVKTSLALAGSIFATAAYLVHDEFKDDGYSFLNHINMEDVSGRNLTDEELAERFKRGTASDIAELEKPIVMGEEPCPTSGNPSKTCLVVIPSDPTITQP